MLSGEWKVIYFAYLERITYKVKKKVFILVPWWPHTCSHRPPRQNLAQQLLWDLEELHVVLPGLKSMMNTWRDSRGSSPMHFPTFLGRLPWDTFSLPPRFQWLWGSLPTSFRGCTQRLHWLESSWKHHLYSSEIKKECLEVKESLLCNFNFLYCYLLITFSLIQRLFYF